jgi:hypothetical protein
MGSPPSSPLFLDPLFEVTAMTLRSKLFVPALALLALSGLLPSAAMASSSQPSATISVDGQTTTTPLSIDRATDAVTGSASGPYFNWTVNGNTDPFLSYSATVTPQDSSIHHFALSFGLPISGGPFNQLTNQAHLTLTDNGGDFGATVSNVAITGLLDATLIPGVTLSGDLTAPHGTTRNLDYGPAIVQQNFGSPSLLTVKLDFDFISQDGANSASAAFNGTLTLDTAPVVALPAALPGGLALLGLLGTARLVQRLRPGHA